MQTQNRMDDEGKTSSCQVKSHIDSDFIWELTSIMTLCKPLMMMMMIIIIINVYCHEAKFCALLEPTSVNMKW